MDERNPYYPSQVASAGTGQKATKLIAALCGLEIVTRFGTFVLVNRLVIALSNATPSLLDGWSRFPLELGVSVFLFSIPFGCIRINAWAFWIATSICVSIVYYVVEYGLMTNAGSNDEYGVPISVTMIIGSWLILMAYRHIYRTLLGE